MDSGKLDRRSRRTRHLLRDALIALMQEKRFEAITVQDLIDRADVGRSTFYAHYQSKEDLFLRGFEEDLGELIQRIEQQDQGGALVPSLELFRHVQEHHRLYQALVWGQAIDSIYRTCQDYLKRTIEQRILRRVGDERKMATPLPVLADYLAGSLVNMSKWWLDNRMPYPPERMHEIYQQLVMPGVCVALNDDDRRRDPGPKRTEGSFLSSSRTTSSRSGTAPETKAWPAGD
jgi:AcrR family transcriptional regulator